MKQGWYFEVFQTFSRLSKVLGVIHQNCWLFLSLICVSLNRLTKVDYLLKALGLQWSEQMDWSVWMEGLKPFFYYICLFTYSWLRQSFVISYDKLNVEFLEAIAFTEQESESFALSSDHWLSQFYFLSWLLFFVWTEFYLKIKIKLEWVNGDNEINFKFR